MKEPSKYPLGYSGEEAQRLANQAALYEDLTEDVLRRAGLRAGMRVLDLGCGVGDVTLLAARIVGATGLALGVDRAAGSIETSRRRAVALGVANVRFEVAQLDTFDPDGSFDAIIGRLVLLYLPDPAAVLHRLARRVPPGGIIAFQEMDMSQLSQRPASALFDRVRKWILGAFKAGGAELDMGSKLLTTFLSAGLPPPAMIAASRVESGPHSPAYEYLAGVLRSLLPTIERDNIATMSEIEINTLSERLRQDTVLGKRVIFLPRLIGAWSKLAPRAGETGAIFAQ
jgi:ubiquinone/menaquinone biosynthesis C-methylase UbiE